ncbi:MAG: hypothetical protein Q4P06_07775 [Actinomycetaceae bacterium]|nr:hypothetical protein [Actinomycetaceae bacterium]
MIDCFMLDRGEPHEALLSAALMVAVQSFLLTTLDTLLTQPLIQCAHVNPEILRHLGQQDPASRAKTTPTTS